MKYIEGTPQEIRELINSPNKTDGASTTPAGLIPAKLIQSQGGLDSNSTNSVLDKVKFEIGEYNEICCEPMFDKQEDTNDFIRWFTGYEKQIFKIIDKLKQENKSKIDDLPIPKNHSQRMYKFGYDTARQDFQTAKQCLNFQDMKCNNKECINECCPLNKVYDRIQDNSEVKDNSIKQLLDKDYERNN